jgi:hypothetical protein
METVSTIDKSSESRKNWRQANPHKLAEYARNYYHKRASLDPEYKKKLCEKEKENKAKRNSIKINRSVGRPLKYTITNSMN